MLETTMPTFPRSRSRLTGEMAGGYATRTHKFGGTWTYNQAGHKKRYEVLADWIGGNPNDWPDKPANRVDKKIIKPCRVKTTAYRSGYTTQVDYHFGLNNPFNIGSPVYFSDQELINKVAGVLNPRKPIVDLPLFLFELRELPSLIRATGNALLRPRRSNPSDSYLAYNFGWAPLLGDLTKLLSLVPEMEKRKDQIDKYRRKLRAEGGLGSSSRTWYSSKKYQSLIEGGVYYWLRHQASVDAWYVITFKTYNPPPTDGLEGYARFTQALTSGSPMQTLWNALPWSWLVDYFLSIGSYLEANQGITYFDTDSVNLCQSGHVQTSVEVDKFSSFIEVIDLNTGHGENRAWQRHVYPYVKPRIRFTPFLSGKQTSILAALALSSGKYNRAYR